MPNHRYYGISDQAKAARHRLDDAQVLLDNDRWRGAMYMAGYAVECLLKTKLMAIFGCQHLQQLEERLRERGLLGERATVFTHQLELLLRLASGLERLRQHAELWQQFNIVNRWVPAWRYNARAVDPSDAADFLAAVGRIVAWLENNL
jgi:HEPN domain-containing protein